MTTPLPPRLPNGLAGRVLDNLHHYQTQQLQRETWLWRSVFATLTAAFIGSIAFAFYRFSEAGTADFLTTIALNYDAISWRDCLFGLLEVVPLDSVALLALATTLLFGFFSLHKKTHDEHFHVA